MLEPVSDSTFYPSDKFEQFWSVNRRLMERTGDDPYFKFIPFRIFQVMCLVTTTYKFTMLITLRLVFASDGVVLGVSANFTPWRVRPPPSSPYIDSSSDQVLQIYLSHSEKKRQYCEHDETKLVYFSFFNPLKVNDELEIDV